MSKRRRRKRRKQLVHREKRGPAVLSGTERTPVHLKLDGLGQPLRPIGRRSLLAVFALAAFLWLLLGDGCGSRSVQ
jgi:hypothetical protein